MEDDNALDIIKWLFKDITLVDYLGELRKRLDNGDSIQYQVKNLII